MGLSNIRKPTEMYVLCLKDIERFEQGKKYHIIMEQGAIMTSPTRIQFRNWVEFVDFFSRIKIR